MLKPIRTAFFVCAVVAACAVQARAESIGPNCGTCQGATYSLEFLGQVGDIYGGDLANDTFQYRLTVDATNYNGGGVAIDEVAIKISSAVDQAHVAGTNVPGGTSLWTIVSGGLNSDGCSGTGSGWDCADWILKAPSLAVVPGNIWSWTFNIDIASPLLDFNGLDAPSIKVRYVDGDGNKVGSLVSEKVPEPGTLALLGLGASVAAIRRRRTQR